MSKSGLLLSFVVALASCVVGAPPGFSSGDNWEVPLIAPLEDDVFLVPVSINDAGPFVFMVDPDSEVSSIEASIQSSLGLYAARSRERKQNEKDKLVHIVLAEVPTLTVGNLRVRHLRVRVHENGTFAVGGRRVQGILGRDVIADSLIYSFDRDRGMMHIATQGHMAIPADAKAVSFSQSYGLHRRYLADFVINQKHSVTMHLDLGARVSLLWPKLLAKFKVPMVPVSADLVDEFGTRRTVESGGIVGQVASKDAQATSLLVLPYADERLEPEDVDGVIGQNFWSKFNIVVDWHRKVFHLTPRSVDLPGDAEHRIARWGELLSGCARPGCIEVVRETVPEPSTPSLVPASAAKARLVIARSSPGSALAYDALIGAVDAEGKLLHLPLFLASFASGVSSLMVPELSQEYDKVASFVVLDVNPVGQIGCAGTTCVHTIAPPR